MTMVSKIIAVSVFAIFLPVLYAAENEQLTITTYYPSPYGSYNELSTGILRYKESAPLTCDNSNRGVVFYGNYSGFRNLYLCDGTEWKALSEQPFTENYQLGGYHMPGEKEFIYSSGSGNKVISNSSSIWEIDNPSNTNIIEPAIRASVYPTTGEVYGVRINYRSLPGGTYVFDWGANLGIDQFDGGRQFYGRLYLQYWNGESWANLDWTESYYDSVYTKKRSDWSDTNNYSVFDVARTYSRSYSTHSSTSDVNRNYRVTVSKEQTTSYMNVRVTNATLRIYRLEDMN